MLIQLTIAVYCPQLLERSPFDVFKGLEEEAEWSLEVKLDSSSVKGASRWSFEKLWQLQVTSLIIIGQKSRPYLFIYRALNIHMTTLMIAAEWSIEVIVLLG